MQNYVHDFFYNDLDYYEGYESFCYQNCLRLLLKAMGISNPCIARTQCSYGQNGTDP